MSPSPPASQPRGRRSSSSGGSARSTGRTKGTGKAKAPALALTAWEKFGFTTKGKARPSPAADADGGRAAPAAAAAVTPPAERGQQARAPGSIPAAAGAGAAAVHRGSPVAGDGKEPPAAAAGKPSASSSSADRHKAQDGPNGGGHAALLNPTKDGDAAEKGAPSAKQPAAARPSATAAAPRGGAGGAMVGSDDDSDAEVHRPHMARCTKKHTPKCIESSDDGLYDTDEEEGIVSRKEDKGGRSQRKTGGRLHGDGRERGGSHDGDNDDSGGGERDSEDESDSDSDVGMRMGRHREKALAARRRRLLGKGASAGGASMDESDELESDVDGDGTEASARDAVANKHWYDSSDSEDDDGSVGFPGKTSRRTPERGTAARPGAMRAASTESTPTTDANGLKPLFEVGDAVYAAWWDPESDPRREDRAVWYPGTIASYRVVGTNRFGPVRIYNVEYDDGDELDDLEDYWIFHKRDYELTIKFEEMRRKPKGVKRRYDPASTDRWARDVGWYAVTVDGTERHFSLLSDAIEARDANNNATNDNATSDNATNSNATNDSATTGGTGGQGPSQPSGSATERPGTEGLSEREPPISIFDDGEPATKKPPQAAVTPTDDAVVAAPQSAAAPNNHPTSAPANVQAGTLPGPNDQEGVAPPSTAAPNKCPTSPSRPTSIASAPADVQAGTLPGPNDQEGVERIVEDLPGSQFDDGVSRCDVCDVIDLTLDDTDPDPASSAPKSANKSSQTMVSGMTQNIGGGNVEPPNKANGSASPYLEVEARKHPYEIAKPQLDLLPPGRYPCDVRGYNTHPRNVEMLAFIHDHLSNGSSEDTIRNDFVSSGRKFVEWNESAGKWDEVGADWKIARHIKTRTARILAKRKKVVRPHTPYEQPGTKRQKLAASVSDLDRSEAADDKLTIALLEDIIEEKDTAIEQLQLRMDQEEFELSNAVVSINFKRNRDLIFRLVKNYRRHMHPGTSPQKKLQYFVDLTHGEGNFLSDKLASIVENTFVFDLLKNSERTAIGKYSSVLQLPVENSRLLHSAHSSEVFRSLRGKTDFVVSDPPYVRMQNGQNAWNNELQDKAFWMNFVCTYGVNVTLEATQILFICADTMTMALDLLRPNGLFAIKCAQLKDDDIPLMIQDLAQGSGLKFVGRVFFPTRAKNVNMTLAEADKGIKGSVLLIFEKEKSAGKQTTTYELYGMVGLTLAEKRKVLMEKAVALFKAQGLAYRKKGNFWLQTINSLLSFLVANDGEYLSGEHTREQYLRRLVGEFDRYFTENVSGLLELRGSEHWIDQWDSDYVGVHDYQVYVMREYKRQIDIANACSMIFWRIVEVKGWDGSRKQDIRENIVNELLANYGTAQRNLFLNSSMERLQGNVNYLREKAEARVFDE